MQLEDHFDFVSNDEIRLRGTQAGLNAARRAGTQSGILKEAGLTEEYLSVKSTVEPICG